MRNIFNNIKHFTLQIFSTSTLFISTCAFAQTSESPVGQALSYAYNTYVLGTDGIIVSSLALTGVGFAWFKFHAVELRTVFIVVGAIGLVFGAPHLVQAIKSAVS